MIAGAIVHHDPEGAMENQSTWDEEEVWIQNGPNEEEEDAEDASEDEAPSRKRPRISKLSPQNIRAVTLLAAYEMRFGHAPPRDIWEFDLPSYLSGTVSRMLTLTNNLLGSLLGSRRVICLARTRR